MTNRKVRGALITIIVLCIFALTGCGMKSAQTDDVLTQAQKASENLKSYEATSEASIRVGIKENPLVDMKLNSDIKVQTEPMLAYSKNKIKMKDQDTTMEMYLDKEKGYLNIPQSSQWYKIDTSDATYASLDQEQQTDPIKALNLLKKYTDDMEMTSNKDNYEFHIKSEDGKMNDFIQDYLKEAMPVDQAQALGAVLDNLAIDTFDYTYKVDKKTYQPISSHLKLEASINVTGHKLDFIESMDSDYKNVNQVTNLSIPDEVKTQAIPMPDDVMNGLSL